MGTRPRWTWKGHCCAGGWHTSIGVTTNKGAAGTAADRRWPFKSL